MSYEVRKLFSYLSTKTYGVCIQENQLNEAVLLIAQNKMFELMDKKILSWNFNSLK